MRQLAFQTDVAKCAVVSIATPRPIVQIAYLFASKLNAWAASIVNPVVICFLGELGIPHSWLTGHVCRNLMYA